MIDSMWSHGKRGYQIGGVLGCLVAARYCTKWDTDGVADRAYMLRMNKRVVFMDRLTLYSTLAGAGVAAYIGDELAKGAWFGYTCGFATSLVLAYVAI